LNKKHYPKIANLTGINVIKLVS